MTATTGLPRCDWDTPDERECAVHRITDQLPGAVSGVALLFALNGDIWEVRTDHLDDQPIDASVSLGNRRHISLCLARHAKGPKELLLNRARASGDLARVFDGELRQSQRR
jgi:hypothetical protein